MLFGNTNKYVDVKFGTDVSDSSATNILIKNSLFFNVPIVLRRIFVEYSKKLILRVYTIICSDITETRTQS